MTEVKIYIQKYIPLVMVALLLCICLGPTIKSIGVGFALFVILIAPTCRHDLAFIFSKPISIAAIGFCTITLIACAWSIGSHEQQLSMIEKYGKLLFIPIFAVGFSHKKIRYFGIQAFLIGMFITCMLSLYKYVYPRPVTGVIWDPGQVFYNHIVTSYMMATAAYLAAWMGIHIKSRPLKLLYFMAVFLFSFQIIFVNTGRTGYVIYLILLTLFLLQNFHLKSVRYTILTFVLSLSLVIQQTHHETLSKGVHMMMTDIHNYQQGHQNSNLGFRLQFHRYAKLLFLEKPLLGQGTGSFIPHFVQDNPIPEWINLAPNPHSQYWLIASEFGLLGLFGWGCFLIILVNMSFRLQEMCSISQAILLPFLVANFSDTFLVTSGIGYLFIAFMGLCLGEFIEMHQQNPSSALRASPPSRGQARSPHLLKERYSG